MRFLSALFVVAFAGGFSHHAQAALSCDDFLVGAALDDMNVAKQTAEIIKPLVEHTRRLATALGVKFNPQDPTEGLLFGALQPFTPYADLGVDLSIASVNLSSLQQDCRANREDTLQEMVSRRLQRVLLLEPRAEAAAAHRKAEAEATAKAKAEYAAATATAEAETRAQLPKVHYERYGVDLEEITLHDHCRDYSLAVRKHDPIAATMVDLIYAWAAVEDDDGDDRESREGMHGVGAPQLPRLEMSQEAAKAGLECILRRPPR